MKAAVCISGQMRTYRQTSDSLVKNLIAPLSADVFIHTWDKAGNTNKLILFLPRGFHFKLPSHYWHDQPDLLAYERCQFAQDLPYLYRELQNLATADEDVTSEGLQLLFNPIDQVVEPFDTEIFERHLDLLRLKQAFDDNTCLNAAPMFYKIAACDALRRRREDLTGVRYDVVVRTRPDLLYPNPLDLTSLHISGRLRTLHNPFYDELGIAETHSNDMFFVGDSETMTYACSVWDELPSYWDPNCDPDWPLSTRGPELVLNRHLRKRNLHNDIVRFDPAPHRVVTGIGFSRLIELLGQDMIGFGQLPDFVRDCVGICQSIFAVDLFASGRGEEAKNLLAHAVDIHGYVCSEPHAGRAKVASLKGDDNSFAYWRKLAVALGQQQAFPDLFEP